MGNTIGKVKKVGRIEEIQISVVNSGGQKCVDARLNYQEDGKWLPTKMGLRVTPDEARKLATLIRRAAKEIDEQKKSK
ncbi:PC4/YdbC family ssDNA-binding protein [Chloroflexota bacterium]